jgi:Tfp pilus assembly protein PilF
MPKLLSVVLSLAVCAAAEAAAPTWYEIQSAHFRVITDGTEKEGRVVAREFEQIRAVVATLLPDFRDSAAPILVVAARNEESARQLIPEFWKRSPVKPGDVSWYGMERRFSLIRLDFMRRGERTQLASLPYQAIYHMYTRSLLNENFAWLPAWLRLGFAEFFANTRFQGGRVYVGAPSPRLNSIQDRPLFPLRDLIDVPTDRIPRVQTFYAQSWALVHMLMMKPNDEGKTLVRFLSLLESGQSQEGAFRQAIGDFDETESELARYVARRSFQNLVLSDSPQAREDSFAARRLTAAEADAEIGIFQIWQRDMRAARIRFERALKADPQSSLAHEGMGLIHFSDGNDQEAFREFDRAVQLSRPSYLAHYYRAMLSPQAVSDDASDQAIFRSSLLRALELNPNFAPAYAELAALDIRQNNLQAALLRAQQAQRLAPVRGAYTALVASLLRSAGREQEAAALAGDAPGRRSGSDRDVTMAARQTLPDFVQIRIEGPVDATSPANKTSLASGKVDSVTCSEKQGTVGVVLDGVALALRAPEKVIVGRLSTNLWYSVDHFDFCHHLEGLQAEIYYYPPARPNEPGLLAQFNVRRDFPIPSKIR